VTVRWSSVWAVARKDLMVVSRSRAVVIPMIILPIIMLVVWPGGLALALTIAPKAQLNEPQALMAALPLDVRGSLSGMDGRQRMLVVMIEYLLAPMFLIVPLMVAIVIAADSIAGERERKTLEPLLYTPTTDLELLMAKAISAWLPAVAIALVSFVGEIIVVNASGWQLMGRLFFPSLSWVVLALWVSPAAAAVGLSTIVIVSARVRSFQEANQIGGLVVLPIVALVIGQVAGVFLLTPMAVVALGVVLWVAAAGLLRLGVRLFRRTQVIGWV
jgi:ABC-2 type transport system permease protein